MRDLPRKDTDEQQGIAPVWRPVLRGIVHALVEGDYELRSCDSRVKRPSEEGAEQLRLSVEEYGDVSLIELPGETWKSSVSIWAGSYWEALVDLWTAEEGRSDLVLSVEIRESEGSFVFDVYGIMVP